MTAEIENYLSDIFALIYTKADLGQILFDIEVFGDRIGYKSVMTNGGEDPEKRKALIISELRSISSEVLSCYFQMLLDKNDLWLFEPNHFKMFAKAINKEAERAEYIYLTTAIPLHNEDIHSIAEGLSLEAGKKVVIDLKVDRMIVAGAVIKKDSYIFDFSVRTKLQNLGSEWKKSIEKAREIDD